MSRPVPVSLIGRGIRLDPLVAEDASALAGTVADGRLWENPYAMAPSAEAMPQFITARLRAVAEGSWVAFTVRRIADGAVLGLTNYLNIEPENRRAHIGGTWYAASVQGTTVNPEAKWLLLEHAFEELDLLGVELRAHVLNTRSRAAIEKLGARLDGILRQNLILPDKTVRDTAVYSILAAEWPEVRAGLEARLGW